jgi:HD-GYP domain-containing protein (c-di-GMP phosphodiesterase class II)
MNPFEYQKYAPRFDTRNFSSKQDLNDLSSKKSRPREIKEKKPNIEKLRPVRKEKFDLEEVLRINHSTTAENITKLHEKLEKERLKTFFQSGDLEKITNFLMDKKLEDLSFYKEISRLKKDYGNQFADADFLTKEDWRILTALEIFDKNTFEHSLGTYLVAKNKLEKRLTILDKEIIREGVELRQFYRACLFHDIGKMSIPPTLLNSKLTDDNWVMGFMMLDEEKQDDILVENNLIVPDAIRNSPRDLMNFFRENRIRAVKFVPLEAVLLKDQKVKLEKLHIDIHRPLGTIMQIHEKKSEEILLKLGYVVESLLAGNHHNYKHHDKKQGEKRTSLSSMHISKEFSANLIHLADMQQALSSERSYHHKQPVLRMLAFLTDDAEQDIIDPTVTAIWIQDELQKMNADYLKEIRQMKSRHQHHDYLQSRNTELLAIDDFLHGNLKLI